MSNINYFVITNRCHFNLKGQDDDLSSDFLQELEKTVTQVITDMDTVLSETHSKGDLYSHCYDVYNESVKPNLEAIIYYLKCGYEKNKRRIINFVLQEFQIYHAQCVIIMAVLNSIKENCEVPLKALLNVNFLQFAFSQELEHRSLDNMVKFLGQDFAKNDPFLREIQIDMEETKATSYNPITLLIKLICGIISFIALIFRALTTSSEQAKSEYDESYKGYLRTTPLTSPVPAESPSGQPTQFRQILPQSHTAKKVIPSPSHIGNNPKLQQPRSYKTKRSREKRYAIHSSSALFHEPSTHRNTQTMIPPQQNLRANATTASRNSQAPEALPPNKLENN